MKKLVIFLAYTLSVFIAFEAHGESQSSQGRGASCPAGAVTILPGASIQEAVHKAGPNAIFCLKSGVYRTQVVRPAQGQRFYGEGQAILNGARIVSGFKKEGPYWTAAYDDYYERRHGECAEGHDSCNLPLRLYIDNKPLERATNREDVKPGSSFFDNQTGKIFIASNPEGKTVELTVGRFAFQSAARDVLINGIIVEKYANPAQDGAINGKIGTNWRVEDCEARFNSGAGISVGPGGSITGSNIHHNGQIGAVLVGANLALKGNQIYSNNIFDFDYKWEAGGAKIAEGKAVIISGNFVHHNKGPGLWCDIDCHDVIYENNKVEYNADAGIFHEISYKAVIRNNEVRFNGQDRDWYWGAQIQIAASENVEAYGNKITVSDDGRGIMLIDQSRRKESGGLYKTRNNYVHDNFIRFEGGAHSGGVSDAEPGGENYKIIEAGNNRFDRNTYELSPSSDAIEFIWGHDTYDWNGFRGVGQEGSGEKLVTSNNN